MVHWASWRYLHKTLQTTYGAHIYDVRRAIQARVTTSASDLDHINVFKWWDLPLSYRGTNGFTFTNNAQTTWLTCSTATISPQASAEAAVEGQVTAVGKADGTLIQNINAAAVLGNNLFVVMNNAWHQLDLKHCGQYGYTAWAREVFDIEAAAQGSGAPCPGPAELFCAQDAGAGAAVGTIYYAGSAAPASVALFDSSQNLVTTLTLTDNGVTNKVGSITVTRSGTGSLTEGEQLLLVQTTDLAGHVLHKPVDFRVGQPSTQTVPRLWTIPGSATLPDSDFTMVGKDAHGLVDANKYWIAGWVNPSVISGNQYIIALGAGHGHLTDLLVRVTSTGTLGIVTHDDANTLLTNISIASVFAAGQPTWFFIDLDYSVSQPTAKGYFNKNGAGSTVVNATGRRGDRRRHAKHEPRHPALLRPAGRLDRQRELRGPRLRPRPVPRQVREHHRRQRQRRDRRQHQPARRALSGKRQSGCAGAVLHAGRPDAGLRRPGRHRRLPERRLQPE
jgi:hypothetical protein